VSDKPLLSIIVPVYNAEKYLARCLDSILAQTFKDFECIIVDDGSVDQSPAICDEYAGRDGRIQVLHKKNEGVSAARNDGIQTAAAGYIAFVDSDDTIHPEMYERMYTAITAGQNDFVCCGYYHKEKNYSLPNNYFNGSQAEMVYTIKKAELFDYIWNKLYRAEIIRNNNIRFPQGYSFGEDFLFNLNYFLFVHSGCCITDILYFYTINNVSVSKVRPYFEHSLFRFTNISSSICKLKDSDTQRFKNRLLARDFTFTVFLLRNLYIPVCLSRQKRIDLLSNIKSFYRKNNAANDFMGFHYVIFYHAFTYTPIALFDLVLNILFKILYKIRGYS
jgi:glycosyltransferase involved in cell wall biosynthesis